MYVLADKSLQFSHDKKRPTGNAEWVGKTGNLKFGDDFYLHQMCHSVEQQKKKNI